VPFSLCKNLSIKMVMGLFVRSNLLCFISLHTRRLQWASVDSWQGICLPQCPPLSGRATFCRVTLVCRALSFLINAFRSCTRVLPFHQHTLVLHLNFFLTSSQLGSTFSSPVAPNSTQWVSYRIFSFLWGRWPGICQSSAPPRS